MNPRTENRKESIWNRDLLDNKAGVIFTRFIVPPFLILFGLGVAVAGAPIAFSFVRPDVGFVFAGATFICFGVLQFATKTIRPSSSKGMKIQRKVSLVAFGGTMVSIAGMLTLGIVGIFIG